MKSIKQAQWHLHTDLQTRQIAQEKIFLSQLRHFFTVALIQTLIAMHHARIEKYLAIHEGFWGWTLGPRSETVQPAVERPPTIRIRRHDIARAQRNAALV